MSKQKELDQYFTPDEVSDYCVKFFKEVTGVEEIDCIEPAAGGGSFVRALRGNGFKNILQYDLDPRSEEVVCQDFLELEESLTGKAVITNPPFGKVSATSIKFFNKAAALNSEYIAMLTLSNLTTNRLIRKLDKKYTLVDEVFIIVDFVNDEGKEIYKKCRCVFSVFKKSEVERLDKEIQEYLKSSKDFQNCDFYINNVSKDLNKVYKDKSFLSNEKYYSSKVEHKYINSKINGKYLSSNISPIVSDYENITEITQRAIFKYSNHRSWCGYYVYVSDLNEFIDDYLNGRTLKTKEF